MGCWCAEKAFRRARRRFLMLLACLRFRPRRRTGRAGPRPPDVEGATPPPVRLRRLRGGRAGAPGGAPQVSLPAGVAPSNQSLRTLSGIDITCFIQGTYGFSEDVLPPIMPPGKNRIPLALPGRIGTIGPDRIGTTGPQSEPAIPVSPQAAGPAVPEREIGPGTGSGVLWHARGLEMAACPAKLADSGGRTPSKALSTSTPSWIRATRWRRQQPPRPERDGSIISASGGQGDGVV